jgi:hypothetical protein
LAVYGKKGATDDLISFITDHSNMVVDNAMPVDGESSSGIIPRYQKLQFPVYKGAS